MEQNVDPLPTWGNLTIAGKSLDKRLRPGVELPILGDAMVQIYAGEVMIEHVADAIIGAPGRA